MFQVRKLGGYIHERMLQPVDNKVFRQLDDLYVYYMQSLKEWSESRNTEFTLLSVEDSIILERVLSGDYAPEDADHLSFLGDISSVSGVFTTHKLEEN